MGEVWETHKTMAIAAQRGCVTHAGGDEVKFGHFLHELICCLRHKSVDQTLTRLQLTVTKPH